MSSLRIIGSDRLVTLMKVERETNATSIDLGFLLFGGSDFTPEVATELLCAMQKNNKG